MYSNNKIPSVPKNNAKKQPNVNNFTSFTSFPTPGAKSFFNEPSCPINDEFPSHPSFPTPGPSVPICVEECPFPSQILEDLRVCHNATFANNVHIRKNLDISGVIDAKYISVKTTGYFDNIETNDLTIYNSFNIPNNEITVSALHVINNVNILGSVNISGCLTVDSLDISNSDIEVNSASFNNNVFILGCLTVSCLDVLHDVQLNNATFYGHIDVAECIRTDCLEVSNSSEFQSAAFHQDIIVDGCVKANCIEITGQALFNSATFYGDVTILGSFNYSGFNFDLNELFVCSLMVNNESILNGTLDVYGNSTFTKNISVSSLNVSHNVNIGGNLRVNNSIVVNNATFGQRITTSSLFVSNNSILNGNLFVSGNTSFNQNVFISSLLISNNLQINGDLNIDGCLTVSCLSVSNLFVSDNTIMDGTLDLSGLNVSNNVFINGDLTVSGNINLPTLELILDNTTNTYLAPISGSSEYYVSSYNVSASFYDTVTYWQALTLTAGGPTQTNNGYLLNNIRVVVSGGATYIYGIEQADNNNVCGVWRWGQVANSWSLLATMNSGGNSQLLRALVVTSNNLYVATDGLINGFSGIVRYDMQNDTWNPWATIPGESNYINAMELDGLGNIYVGGTFSSISGVNANNIAKWNGVTWTALGGGITCNVNNSPCVRTIAFDSNNNLYVAGNISLVNSVQSVIGKWNISSSTWTNFPTGPFVDSTNIRSLAVNTNLQTVYIASNLNTGGINSFNLNSQVFTAIQNNISVDGYALGIDRSGYVYLGGNFSQITVPPGNTPVPGTTNIARYNPYNGTWNQLGGGLEGSSNIVYNIQLDANNNVYACGSFTTAGFGAGQVNGAINVARYMIGDSLTQVSNPFKKIKYLSGQYIYRNNGITEYGNTLTFYNIADVAKVLYNNNRLLGFVQYLSDDVVFSNE